MIGLNLDIIKQNPWIWRHSNINPQIEEQRQKNTEEKCTRDLWETTKHCIICAVEIPEENRIDWKK